MNARSHTMTLVVAMTSIASVYADVSIGYREIGGQKVESGEATLSGTLMMDPSATFLKTGAGSLEIPAAQVDARAPWSVDVLDGTLKLTGAAATPTAGDAPAAMQKAKVWLDASTLAEGDLSTWTDCRGNGYSAVARQLRAETPAAPVVTTIDGVKCVDFGGLSDKYMRFLQNGGETTLTRVQHWFFVYGFKDIGSPMLGCDSGYKWERGPGMMTVLGDDSVRWYDDDITDPYFYDGRGDMVNRDAVARHYVDGRRIDPFSMRPKKGFQLFEGDQQKSPQEFQTIFFKCSETFVTASGRAGGNYVCEVVLFDVCLTEEERLAVERYLMAKWSLPRQKSVTGDEPRTKATGEIRVADGANAEVSVPAGEESLPLTFGGKGSVVKSGDGTLVIGPSGSRPHQGGFTLAGGDVLVRGGSMPAIVAKGGESWNAAISPSGRPATVAACAASGFRVTKTAGASADAFVKSGYGEVAVSVVDGSARKLRVEDGVLKLAATEGADVDTGVVETGVAIPNASFEAPFSPGENQEKGFWQTGLNDWFGFSFYYHTQYPAPLSTWTSYLTPCGTNVMMVVVDNNGYAQTDVTFPRAGTYELSLWATSRYSDGRRNCLDVKFNDKIIGHLQTAAGPFVRYRFRFDIAAEDAGTSHKLKFSSMYGTAGDDSNTILDGLEIHPVAAWEKGIVKVPNGDFDRRKHAEGETTMRTYFSRDVKHDGWTLSLTDDAPYTDEKFGYIAFCAGGCTLDKMQYYPSQDLNSGSGVLGFFGKYGRATTTAFTLPAGRWLLRGDLAWWMSYTDTKVGGVSGFAAKPVVGAWLVRGGNTESLGTITTFRHNMGSFCWPKVIEVAADESVQLVVGNTNGGSGVLDNLVFVSADVASGDENLIPDPFCERKDFWTAYKDQSYYELANVKRQKENDNKAYGLDVFEGDYCLRLHNASGFYTPVVFPAAGLYRLTFHARPRPDSKTYSINPVRAFVRLNDGSDLEIFRMKRMELFWRYAEYSALFEIPADKLPADGKLKVYIHGLGVAGDAAAKTDRSTYVDGVSIVKVDPATVVSPTVPETTRLYVAEGAMLNLDYPGTKVVKTLSLGGVHKPAGVYNAANCPGYLTGMGSVEVKPDGMAITIR